MRYLALDMGTTTIKGLVYDENGTMVFLEEAKTKTYSPKSDYMEKDGEECYEAVLSILKSLVKSVQEEKETLGFISLSCYMHSVMAVDRIGKPLTRLMMWNDGRAYDYTARYKANGVGYRIYEKTGTPIHPMAPLYKLMWLRDYETEVFKNAHKFISMKEFLVYRMTGDYLVDYAMASATGMFDLKALTWNEMALEEIGLEEDRLSTPCPTTTIKHKLLKEFMDKIGAKEEIPLVLGATDGCLANLGSHGTRKNTGVVTIGTSGAVRVVTDQPLIDKEARTFSYILDEGLYVSGGATNNGGLVYEWMTELFGDEEDLDQVLGKSQMGAKGLIFLPFITGERAPYWNSRLRGSFLGLSQHHSPYDLMEAAIEGVSFALLDVFMILQSLVSPVEVIYANGGFTKSTLWIRRLASIFQKDMIISNQGDAALFGAYLLGLKATGVIEHLEDSEAYFHEERVYQPEESKLLPSLFQIYKEAIVKNQQILEKLSSLQEK